VTYHRNRISRRRRAARYWRSQIDRAVHKRALARRLFREGKWMAEWLIACEAVEDARVALERARKRGRA
jgi:hypothetical protein